LSMALRGWQQQSLIRQRVISHAQWALRRMQRLGLGAAFTSWQSRAMEQARLRLVLRRAVMKMAHRTLAMALEKWLRQANRHRVVLTTAQWALRRMQQMDLSVAFTGWQSRTTEQARLRLVLRRAVTKLTHRTLSMALRGWQQQSLIRQRVISHAQWALQRMQRLGLGVAFTSWQSRTTEQARLRLVLRRAVTKMTHRTLSMALREWSRQSHRHHNVIATAEWAVRRMRRLGLVLAFTRWEIVVARRRDTGTVLMRAIIILCNRLLSRAWKQWRLQMAQVLYIRVIVRNFRRRCSRRSLWMAWAAWADCYVIDSHEGDAAADISVTCEAKVRHCVRRRKLRKLRQVLQLWMMTAVRLRCAFEHSQLETQQTHLLSAETALHRVLPDLADESTQLSVRVQMWNAHMQLESRRQRHWMLLHCFRRWKGYWSYLSGPRDLLLQRRFRVHRYCRQTWVCWASYASRCRYARVVCIRRLARADVRLRLSAFYSWCSTAQRSSWRRTIVSPLPGVRCGKIAGAFSTWAAWAQKRVYRQRQAQRVSTWSRLYVQRRVLRGWWATVLTDELLRLESALQQEQNVHQQTQQHQSVEIESLRNDLQAQLSNVQRKVTETDKLSKQRRQLCTAVGRRWHTVAVFRCLCEWRNAVAREAWHRLLIGWRKRQYELSWQRRAWNAWVYLVHLDLRVHERTEAEGLLTAMEERMQQLSSEADVEHAAAEKIRDLLKKRSQRSSALQAAGYVWHVWVQHITRVQGILAVRSAAGKRLVHLIFQCWRRLADSVAAASRKILAQEHTVLLRMVSHWHTRLVFCSWAGLVITLSRQALRLQMQVGTSIARHAVRVLVRAWHTWARFTLIRRGRRVRAEAAQRWWTAASTRRQQASMAAVWREWTAHARAAARALGQVTAATLQSHALHAAEQMEALSLKLEKTDAIVAEQQLRFEHKLHACRRRQQLSDSVRAWRATVIERLVLLQKQTMVKRRVTWLSAAHAMACWAAVTNTTRVERAVRATVLHGVRLEHFLQRQHQRHTLCKAFKFWAGKQAVQSAAEPRRCAQEQLLQVFATKYTARVLGRCTRWWAVWASHRFQAQQQTFLLGRRLARLRVLDCLQRWIHSTKARQHKKRLFVTSSLLYRRLLRRRLIRSLEHWAQQVIEQRHAAQLDAEKAFHYTYVEARWRAAVRRCQRTLAARAIAAWATQAAKDAGTWGRTSVRMGRLRTRFYLRAWASVLSTQRQLASAEWRVRAAREKREQSIAWHHWWQRWQARMLKEERSAARLRVHGEREASQRQVLATEQGASALLRRVAVRHEAERAQLIQRAGRATWLRQRTLGRVFSAWRGRLEAARQRTAAQRTASTWWRGRVLGTAMARWRGAPLAAREDMLQRERTAWRVEAAQHVARLQHAQQLHADYVAEHGAEARSHAARQQQLESALATKEAQIASLESELAAGRAKVREAAAQLQRLTRIEVELSHYRAVVVEQEAELRSRDRAGSHGIHSGEGVVSTVVSPPTTAPAAAQVLMQQLTTAHERGAHLARRVEALEAELHAERRAHTELLQQQQQRRRQRTSHPSPLPRPPTAPAELSDSFASPVDAMEEEEAAAEEEKEDTSGRRPWAGVGLHHSRVLEQRRDDVAPRHTLSPTSPAAQNRSPPPSSLEQPRPGPPMGTVKSLPQGLLRASSGGGGLAGGGLSRSAPPRRRQPPRRGAGRVAATAPPPQPEERQMRGSSASLDTPRLSLSRLMKMEMLPEDTPPESGTRAARARRV
jgi:hypothetical protein